MLPKPMEAVQQEKDDSKVQVLQVAMQEAQVVVEQGAAKQEQARKHQGQELLAHQQHLG